VAQTTSTRPIILRPVGIRQQQHCHFSWSGLKSISDFFWGGGEIMEIQELLLMVLFWLGDVRHDDGMGKAKYLMVYGGRGFICDDIRFNSSW
jgi:hypothetical protein